MDNLEQALNEIENGFTKNGQSGMRTSLYVTPAKCAGIGSGGDSFKLWHQKGKEKREEYA